MGRNLVTFPTRSRNGFYTEPDISANIGDPVEFAVGSERDCRWNTDFHLVWGGVTAWRISGRFAGTITNGSQKRILAKNSSGERLKAPIAPKVFVAADCVCLMDRLDSPPHEVYRG